MDHLTRNVLGVVGGAALALLAAMVVLLRACDHPSDSRLLRQFREHRVQLEALVTMFEGDRGLTDVGQCYWAALADPSRAGVSAARLADYNRLLAAAGAHCCAADEDQPRASATDGAAEPKDPIWIVVSAHGWVNSGSSKGFFYSDRPPSDFEVVPRLDHASGHGSPAWTLLRHIDGPWYLYLDFHE